MKKILLAMVLVLAMAFPTFAGWDDDNHSITGPITGNATTGNNNVQQYMGPVTATGGAGGQGGQGGTGIGIGGTGIGIGGNAAVIGSGNSNNSNKNTNTNMNTNLNSNKNTNTNTNVNNNTNNNTNTAINEGNTQDQSQDQKQGQAQGQSQINEGNTVNIKNERAFMGVNAVGPAELNYGMGKVDWYYADYLPKVGIPLYSPKEVIKEVVDVTANVPIKKLIKKMLKMKAACAPICFNDRILITKAEAQKSWTTGGSVGGGGAYNGNAMGGAGQASLVPSVGGTKAHDLYTIQIVKVEITSIAGYPFYQQHMAGK
jgi:hypothetical protein